MVETIFIDKSHIWERDGHYRERRYRLYLTRLSKTLGHTICRTALECVRQSRQSRKVPGFAAGIRLALAARSR